MPEIRRVAILDDYQHPAHRYAAWDSLPEGAHLTYFFEHLGSAEEVIAALEPFEHRRPHRYGRTRPHAAGRAAGQPSRAPAADEPIRLLTP